MRTLLGYSKLYLAIICLFLLNFDLSNGSAKQHGKSADLRTLKLAQVLFRHGARSPIHEYPKDPYGKVDEYWPDGLGQLTKKGMMQHFVLGEYLRWRYDRFLPRIYNKEDIFIQSSNLDRTIMSAQANLAGMYPPESQQQWNPRLNWQPIPIHSIPTQYDHILDFSLPCPRYNEEFQNVMKSEYITKVKFENQWLFDYLTENTGKNVETIENVSELYDTFFVQTENLMKLPGFAAEVFPKSMKPLMELHHKMLSGTEEMLKLRGGPLLKQMVSYMDLLRNIDVSKKDAELYANGHLDDHCPSEYKKAKLYVYSGHDTTLAALLNTLGVYNNILPPYASCVMVELHGTETEPDLDFLKFYYMNDTKEFPYELKIPDCGTPCTLKRLKELKNHLMIEDWHKECKSLFTSHDDIPIKEQGIFPEEQVKVDPPVRKVLDKVKVDPPVRTVLDKFDSLRTSVKNFVLSL